MHYNISGTLLEVCTCTLQCGCCWAHERPTGEDCDRVMAWHIERGTAGEVDVSGITVAMLGLLNSAGTPVKSYLYVPHNVTNAQFGALVGLWSGAFGGPLGDLANMLGEFVGVERSTIELDDDGHLVIGSAVSASVRSGAGSETRLTDGASGTLSTAGDFSGSNETLGISFGVSGQRAVRGEFTFAR